MRCVLDTISIVYECSVIIIGTSDPPIMIRRNIDTCRQLHILKKWSWVGRISETDDVARHHIGVRGASSLKIQTSI